MSNLLPLWDWTLIPLATQFRGAVGGIFYAVSIVLMFSSQAYGAPLPICPATVRLLQNTGNSTNLVFLDDTDRKFVTQNRIATRLQGFSFYLKIGDSVTELAPNKNLSTKSEYVFGSDSQIIFGCFYETGALLVHELPKGSVQTCVIKDNLKKSRSVSCR